MGIAMGKHHDVTGCEPYGFLSGQGSPRGALGDHVVFHDMLRTR